MIMNITMDDLIYTQEHIKAMKKDFGDDFKEYFRIGDTVKWMHGRHVQEGIISHVYGFGNRVKAINSKTGNEVWIDFYSIQDAYEQCELEMTK